MKQDRNEIGSRIEQAVKGKAKGNQQLLGADVIAKANRFAALPVLDDRPAGEMIEYDPDGLAR